MSARRLRCARLRAVLCASCATLAWSAVAFGASAQSSSASKSASSSAPSFVETWRWIATPYVLVPLGYALVSTLAFVLYAWDKRAARCGTTRIAESTLHLVECFGGWPGAWCAQRLLRHKTQKLSYQLVFWSIVCVHVAAWLLLAWLAWSPRSSA